jgi:hypothetical protein
MVCRLEGAAGNRRRWIHGQTVCRAIIEGEADVIHARTSACVTHELNLLTLRSDQQYVDVCGEVVGQLRNHYRDTRDRSLDARNVDGGRIRIG